LRVLFVFSIDNASSANRPLASQWEMQFGISYISSLLKQHGHETKLVVLNKSFGRPEDILHKALRSFRPRVVAFTSVFSEFQFVARMARFVRKNYPDTYLLAGGVHASLDPESVMREEFDALCIGEGEFPTLELVTQLVEGKRPSGIPNLWIKLEDQVEKNPPRPFLPDLESLPFPDREMWQEWVDDRAEQRHSVLLGRGCPFRCSYCCNEALRKVAGGKYVRFRSPENILEEIRHILRRFPGTKEIYLEVETVGTNPGWFVGLCSQLRIMNETLPEPLSFGTNLRLVPGADLEPIFAACRGSNFRFINIGLESGCERIRREVLKRNYSNEDVITAVALARKHGLKVSLFNLIGLPGETPADFQETVKVNRVCQPDWHALSIFFPYPGTELYRICEEKGFLPKSLDPRLERSRALLNMPEFSRREIQSSYIWFDYNVYRGLKAIHLILAVALFRKLRSHAYVWRTWRRLSRSTPVRLLRNPFVMRIRK
jgi:radical SAM superfamily enzyme YgiQ (UPF0313 family)